MNRPEGSVVFLSSSCFHILIISSTLCSPPPPPRLFPLTLSALLAPLPPSYAFFTPLLLPFPFAFFSTSSLFLSLEHFSLFLSLEHFSLFLSLEHSSLFLSLVHSSLFLSLVHSSLFLSFYILLSFSL